MNADMAGGAVPVAGIGHVVRDRLRGHAIRLAAKTTSAVMTFQADGKHDGPLQEACVGGTMGGMAGFTPIHADGGMFKEERAALVGVAFHASLFVLQPGIDKMGPAARFPNRGVRTVGIVTIRTGHESLIHAVLEGHGKLRPHVIVAAITDISLLLCEQAFT